MDTHPLISPAEFVISRFGGLTNTAKAIGRPVTTVQGWQERGRVPQDYWTSLIKAAAERGEIIELSDFLKSLPMPQKGEAA